MFKRLFFAIKFPSFVKDELSLKTEELRAIFGKKIKWVEKENFHITLLFLGSVREEKVKDIIFLANKVKYNPFYIALKKISYFPLEKENARLIWVTGDGEDVFYLNRNLQEKVFQKNLEEKEDDFLLHITLGRIKKWDFQKLPLSMIPEVEEDVNISFKVEYFYLIESKLSKFGASYKTVAEFKI